MPARHYAFQWLISLLKQSAYGTASADGAMIKSAFVQGPDLAQLDPKTIADNSQFGRGDEWSHTQEQEALDISLKRGMDLTTLLAGLYCGFGLGAVTTSQPDAGGNPNVYDHDFKPMDAATSVQLPAMTIIESAVNNTGIKKKIQDLVVADFEVSGAPGQRLQLAATLKGSGTWANSTVAAIAPTAAQFLRWKDVKFELGGYGGALTDLSARLKAFSFKWDNKLLDDDGYFPGSGLVRGRHEFGDREIALTFDLLQATDGQELDRLAANTNLAAKITATGAQISGIYFHRLIIDVPDIHYKRVEKKYIDGKLAYGVTCQVNYDDAGGVLYPVKVSVRTDQSAYL